MSCFYCKKEASRGYRGKQLCELHYFKENPSRNTSIVLLRMRDQPPWKIKDRIAFLNEILKHTDYETIEEYLGSAKWFRRLDKKKLAKDEGKE